MSRIGLNCPRLLPGGNLVSELAALLDVAAAHGVRDFFFSLPSFHTRWLAAIEQQGEGHFDVSASVKLTCKHDGTTGSLKRIRATLDDVLKRAPGERLKLLVLEGDLDPFLDDNRLVWLLEQYKESGSITGLGVKVLEPTIAKPLMDCLPLDVVLMNYSICRQEARYSSIFDLLRHEGCLPVVTEPFCSGLLASQFASFDALPASDSRRSLPPNYVNVVLRNMEQVTEYVNKEGYMLSSREIALKFVFQSIPWSPVLIGNRTAEQLEQNLSVLEMPDLPRHVLRTLLFVP